MTTTTTVENAFGNPSRVHGRGLKVFPFLNLSGFGEANERVVFQASVEVFVRRSLSMRRHVILSVFFCGDEQRVRSRGKRKRKTKIFLVVETFILHIYKNAKAAALN